MAVDEGFVFDPFDRIDSLGEAVQMLIGNPMVYRQLPVETALAKIIDAGFDGLELWPPQIIEFRTPALRQRLQHYVHQRGAELIRLNCADRDYFQALASSKDVDRAFDGLQADIDMAAELGMTQLLTWEGRSPDFSHQQIYGEVLDRTTRLFEEACRYAKSRHIALTVEVHPFTLGVDLPWLSLLCDRLRGEPFSVTYDCCHFAVGLPDRYIDAIDLLGERIQHVHFCDSDCVSPELHFAPGAGQLDLDGIVAALKRIGFRGSMMLDLWLYPMPDEGVAVGVPYLRRACETLGLA
ncbi:MAG: sugar phosphate isomerase/epimerase [Pirellulales bacterium]|nr:sugar phosphate isomerase/epimerase [Pirellulales bacterium]